MQGRADDWEADPCSRAEPLEELNGDIRHEADELNGSGSGGWIGRLGRTINNKGDLELGNKDLELGLTSDDRLRKSLV